jgi:hypothetical protein
VDLSLVMPGLVRTELAVGTTDAKGTVVLSPEDVAGAIADALERPRFDVWVPGSYGTLFRLIGPLPRGAREAILRAMGSERGAAGATPAQRAVYEARIAALTDRPTPD